MRASSEIGRRILLGRFPAGQTHIGEISLGGLNRLIAALLERRGIHLFQRFPESFPT